MNLTILYTLMLWALLVTGAFAVVVIMFVTAVRWISRSQDFEWALAAGTVLLLTGTLVAVNRGIIAFVTTTFLASLRLVGAWRHMLEPESDSERRCEPFYDESRWPAYQACVRSALARGSLGAFMEFGGPAALSGGITVGARFLYTRTRHGAPVDL